MKENNVGFTLIELLVVVLIIGILASVALPQYQKAVERSRMAEAMQRLGDYASAQQVYYMHNNGFASDYAALNQGDIKVPEQTEVGTWDTDDSRWEISSASGSSLEKVTMSAQRMSGIYKDCVLTLSVDASGKIEKTCSGNADCCVVAKNSGYEEGQTTTPVASGRPAGWEGSGTAMTYNGTSISDPVYYNDGYGYYWGGAISVYGTWLGNSNTMTGNGTWDYEDNVWYYTEPGVYAGYVAFKNGNPEDIANATWSQWQYGSEYWYYEDPNGKFGSFSFEYPSNTFPPGRATPIPVSLP